MLSINIFFSICASVFIINNSFAIKSDKISHFKNFNHASDPNKITRINESKPLTKHILCECKYKSDGIKFSTNQNWNKELCQCEFKNLIKHHLCEKDM